MSDFEYWAGEEIAQLRSGLGLRKPGPFQSLFRYVGLNTIRSWALLEQMLQRSELVGATAHSLNDPFELSPVRFDDLSATTVPRQPTLSEMLGPKLQETDPEEEKRRIAMIRTEATNFLDTKIRNARVIAFCQQSQSGLLWSHYANSYRGACLHFTARGFSRIRGSLGEVNYSRFRPTYPLSLAAALSRPTPPGAVASKADPIKSAESDKMLFYTKSGDWAYEAEVRIVYDAKKQSAVKFEPNALASVLVGPRMSEKDLDRLRGILNASIYSGVPIRRARLSSTTFSVEQEEAMTIPPA